MPRKNRKPKNTKQPKQPIQKNKEYKPVIRTKKIDPPKPSYASIISNPNDDRSNENVNDETENNFTIVHLVQPGGTRGLRTNCSHHAWERAYIEHVFQLRKIFIREMTTIFPNLDIDSLRSTHFLDSFSTFLYETSSKKISPYLSPMSEELEHAYTEFIIKREELESKDGS